MSSYQKLLTLSNIRRISHKQFRKLFEELYQRSPLDISEFESLLSDVQNENYLTNLSIQNGIIVEYFWKSAPKLSVNRQVKLLKNFQLSIKDIPKDLIVKFVTSFINYCDTILKAKENLLVINEVIFLWELVLKEFDIGENNEMVNPFLIQLLNYLQLNNHLKQFNYCKLKFKLNNYKSSLIKPKLSNLTINTNSKNFENYEFFKFFLHVNNIFKNWFELDNSKLITNFNHNFNINSDNLLKLIYGSFNGLYLSKKLNQPSYLTTNWENYVLARLPQLINSLKSLNTNLDEILLKVLNKIDTKFELGFKQLFIKSLIFNKVLSIKSFNKFFPNEIKVNQQVLIHEISLFNNPENFQDNINEKLLTVNSEFISLDESNLEQYFNNLTNNKSLQCSMHKQSDLSRIIDTSIDKLIMENDVEKINRLLLVLLINHNLLNIILHNYPKGALSLLIKLILLADNHDLFKVNEDNENFLDSYTNFGTIVMTIIKLTQVYRVNDLNFTIKNSFIFNYLNNFERSLGLNFTADIMDKTSNDDIIITNYNELTDNWITSIFNEDGEGLTDELIKPVAIEQIYQLIPLTYQQAIIATVTGKITMKELVNGMDYLSQNFLLPCISSITNWLITKIHLKNNRFNQYLEILNELLKIVVNVKTSSNNEAKLLASTVVDLIHIKVDYCFSNLKDTSNNLMEEIKNKFNGHQIIQSPIIYNFKDINMFDQFKTSLIGYFNGNQEVNFELINYYLNHGNDLMIKHVFMELNSNERTASSSFNDNVKFFIDGLIYMIIVQSIKTPDLKTYWLEKLLNPTEIKTREVDKSFTLSMEYHYSKIFNTDEDDGDGDEDEDEDDELFNEDPFKNKVINYESIIQTINQYSLDLIELNRIYYTYYKLNKNESFIKSIVLVHDKLMKDIEAFHV